MTNNSLAFCFLTRGSHNQENLWLNFLKEATPNSYNIYCHNKNAFKHSDNFLSKYEIPNKIPTEWAGISLVRATLLLFKEAFKNTDNKFFLLASESCIPLWNFNFIKDRIFEYDNNLIYESVNWRPNSGDWNEAQRWQKINHYIKTPRDFKKSSQWLCLDRSTVEFILENDETEYFRNVWAADEHYFLTMINKHRINYLRYPFTFSDWRHQTSTDCEANSHPKEFNSLTTRDVATCNNSFFMRKISASCHIKEEVQSFILSRQD
tara:strand:+ start:2892 stop:3683 length:792 start_codon:yes stop_codon:yes gene_type:complete